MPVPAPAVAAAGPSSFAADSIVDASAAFPPEEEVLPAASSAGTSPAAVHSSGSLLFS